MPPPDKLEKAVGEKRISNFAPVGISICPELDVDAILAGVGEWPLQWLGLQTV